MPPRIKVRNTKKQETIIRIPDSLTGRKRFRVVRGGEHYTVKRSLSGIILGPDGLKVGKKITRRSEVIYASRGISARGSFSKRKRARIKYWGSNRDPRKYPSRIGTKKKT